MSRTRKRKPREIYKGTRVYMPCPRRGYCSWCDRGRLHNATAAETYADQAIAEYKDYLYWFDDYDYDYD